MLYALICPVLQFSKSKVFLNTRYIDPINFREAKIILINRMLRILIFRMQVSSSQDSINSICGFDQLLRS